VDFIELCMVCGLCAVMCPAYSHRLLQVPYQEVQKQIKDYLKGQDPTQAVCERSRLCNECYKCVVNICPRGLDPMRINQMLRGMLHEDGVVPRPFIPPSDPASNERIAAALLTTESEFERITTFKVKGDGRILFFPGCNIYYQPDLLLTAMDVLDSMADNWIFLPGLDHCCGNNHDSAGRLSAGGSAWEDLMATMRSAGAETVVVWCPTCAARHSRDGSSLPLISFARFIADRLGGHTEGDVPIDQVTLHEACKVAYLGLDSEAPREVLRRLSGKPVREMARHGAGTVCCGWSLHQYLPHAGEEEKQLRINEAEETGAGILATVCHGCQWILDPPMPDSAMRVVNYIRLVGEALGIEHRSRFGEMRQMGDVKAVIDAIRDELGDRFERLPFDRSQVERTVKTMIGGFYGS